MLVFGIDKFMSECRALVNFCGNAVATLFVANWENLLDVGRARRVFNGEPVDELPYDLHPDEAPTFENVGAENGASPSLQDAAAPREPGHSTAHSGLKSQR